ncbi:MAG TPA: hypothetical protein VM734_28505 [Kofleriaceae bacterium]|jgi:hypothetical protein|nr:hypothetical protein [Kofleriaceae bacterium]
MRRRLLFAVGAAVALACAACDDDDGFKDGARGPCAAGGQLSGCPDGERTPEAACWRLVECGSLPAEAEDENANDWGRCVNRLESMIEDRATVVIACIAGATCDELLAPGSPHPYEDTFCWRYGEP